MDGFFTKTTFVQDIGTDAILHLPHGVQVTLFVSYRHVELRQCPGPTLLQWLQHMVHDSTRYYGD